MRFRLSGTRILSTVLATLVVLTAWRTAATAQPHQPLAQVGTIETLGVNIHFTDPRGGEMEMLAAGGFRWIRMDFSWGRTERERGRYDFSPYDRLLAALEKHHIRALFILDYSNGLYEKTGSVTTDAGRRAFAHWAAAAAKHFRGHGILWEIWNEPNIRGFWKPEPNVKQYAALALAAAQAIRQAAPRETIIGPATSRIDLDFIEGCFRAGLLKWWDAVSVHPYRQDGPETVAIEYRHLRQLIKRYAPAGKVIPILSSEWGYSSAWKNFNPDLQGKMLARQWLINLAQGIRLSIWYDWHDDGRDPKEPEHHFGTVQHEYHARHTPVYDPKPAYRAARTLTKTLTGYHFVKRLAVANADDYILLFRNGDRLCLAAWTTATDSHDVTVPSSRCQFTIVSHLGERQSAIAARDGRLTITLSAAPRYLIAQSANPKLSSARTAHPLTVEILPGPRRMLLVEIENLADQKLVGKLRLTDLAGVEPVARVRDLNLTATAEKQRIKIPLAKPISSRFTVGLRIEDADGQLVSRVAPRHMVLLPDSMLAHCGIVADGDPKIESEQHLSITKSPRPWPGFSGPVARIDYRFAVGWKFTRLVPAAGSDLRIAGHPRVFACWIHGDGQHMSPRLRIVDTTGQMWQPTGTRIDWKGWRYVKLPLAESSGHWGGADDGKIHFPIIWNSLFLLDKPSGSDKQGTIYFTRPSIIY